MSASVREGKTAAQEGSLPASQSVCECLPAAKGPRLALAAAGMPLRGDSSLLLLLGQAVVLAASAAGQPRRRPAEERALSGHASGQPPIASRTPPTGS